jgi:hypothetical protein
MAISARVKVTVLVVVATVAACGGTGTAGAPSKDGGTGIDDGSSSGSPDAAGDVASSPPVDAGDALAPEGAADASPDLVARLLALTSTCTVASNGKYATDDGVAPTIDICKLNGAFFWKADMDIDCDGQTTAECSAQTDPAYQNQTSFTQQADGKPLIASVLPYVVVPLPSTRFDYTKSNIQPGALVIVIYNGQFNFGVFGDEGPDNIIGEASYAMGKSLGVDPDPATGGVDSGVTYIVFTGQSAVVSPIESHAAATALGPGLAATLLKNN